MPDKLTVLYASWFEKAPVAVIHAGVSLQCFQGGLTVGAVSMRERAMKIIQAAKLSDAERNALLTAVGQLGDIPE